MPQRFIVASLYYFYELEHDRLARHIKSEIELAFKHDLIHDVVSLINRVYDLLIFDELFSEDFIFDLILAKLKHRMESQVEVIVAKTFKKIAVYCSKSFHLRNRIATEYHVCFVKVFSKSLCLELIENGYAEFLSSDIVQHNRFDNNWVSHGYALEYLLAYCIENEITPIWKDLIQLECFADFKDEILERRLRNKALKIIEFVYYI